MRQKQQCIIGWFMKKCNICGKRLWEAWKIKRVDDVDWQIRCYEHLET